MNRPLRVVSFTALFAALILGGDFHSQVRAESTTQPAATAPSDELVDLEFPDDGIELSLLADIVTRRLHIPILYDEQIHGKKVIIRVPKKVPESSLLGILQSALRLKQLALVDAEQPGWKQIVNAPSLATVAKSGQAETADSPVAQVFTLDHADPARLSEIIRPFLSQPGGYVQAEAGQKVLIVADYPGVVRRVSLLIQQLDANAPKLETRFVELKEAEASQVVTAAMQLINNRETYQWGNSTGSGVFLSASEQANQVIVISPPARMDEVLALITGLDKAPQLQTRVYRLKAVSPDRVDQLIHSLLDPALLKRGYQAGIDRDSQMLAVSATPLVHERIADLLKELDVPAPESASPIQFYKLKNTKAADLLSTISELLGDDASSTPQPPPPASGDKSNPPAPVGQSASGGKMASPQAGSPFSENSPSALGSGQTSNASTPSIGSASSGNSDLQNASPVLGPIGGGSTNSSPGVLSVHGKGATVAADVNTNSIIVVGPPATQQMYADLIHRLDERRPQVQIECTIVTLDTTNGLSFGVDIGRLGGSGTSQLLSLSSFGISTANPVTGTLTPTAGTGGTFALLSPRIADVVLRALETNTHARLISAPRLLVNDNSTGKLQSVAQEPYAVILDASSTQSLTSLGGLAQAGTSISVEPHISEANYLQLGYDIELSSFTGAAQNGLPPPSEKNSVDSSVTIPDGYTIVVGGLTTKNFTTSVNTIPILGDIPILKYLFGTRSKNIEDTTLFVFIRPVILRDDQFEDLRYLSSVQMQAAGLPSDFPRSSPIAMH
jgi:general secretion pathway protein D